MTQVAIIVPVYNHPEMFEKCLTSLVSTTQGVQPEIFVIDDSVDNIDHQAIEAIAAEAPVQYYRNPRNVGWTGSTQMGIDMSSAPFILLMNSDIVAPSAGWLEAMLENMSDASVGVVGCKLIFPPDHPQESWRGKIQHAGVATNSYGTPYHPFAMQPGDIPEVNMRREINAVTGACILIRRENWIYSGGWDPHFGKGGYDDVDLCYRMRLMGKKVIYEPKACLWHFQGGSRDEFGNHPLYSAYNQNLQYLVSKWAKHAVSDEAIFGLQPQTAETVKLPESMNWLWPMHERPLVSSILRTWIEGTQAERDTIQEEMNLIGELYKNGSHVPMMTHNILQASLEADAVKSLLAKGFTNTQISQIMGIFTKNNKFPGKSDAQKRHRARKAKETESQ